MNEQMSVSINWLDNYLVWLNRYFEKLRFDPNHHLGLGDIRLTIGQQEEIINKLKEALPEPWRR